MNETQGGKPNRRLTRRLAISVAFIFIAMMAATLVVSHFVTGSVVADQEMRVARHRIEAETERLDGPIVLGNVVMDDVEMRIGATGEEALVSVFTQYQERHGEFLMGVYMGKEDGAFFPSENINIPDGYDPRARPWFIEAMARPGETVVTEPYVDAFTGLLIFTVARRIPDFDGQPAVIGLDMLFHSFFADADGVYSFLISGDYRILYHPFLEAGASLQDVPAYRDILPQIRQGDETIRFADADGAPSYLVLARSELTGWRMAVAVPRSSFAARIRALQALSAGVVAAIIATMSVMFFGHASVSFKRALKELGRNFATASEDLASGRASNVDFGRLDGSFGLAEVNGVFAERISVMRRLIDDMGAMYARHKDGDYEYRLDSAGYDPALKRVADEINEVVGSQVSSKFEILGFVERIAAGDFTADIRAHAGKEAIVNESAEKFRKNIAGIAAAVRKLSRHALEGDIGYRLDPDMYEGEWRHLTAGLNAVMEAVEKPLREIVSMMHNIEGGDFGARVRGEYKGAFKELADAMNGTSSTIGSYIDEIAETLALLSGGDLTQAIRREYVGSLDRIKSSVNQITGELRDTASSIMAVSEKVSFMSRILSSSANTLAGSVSEQSGVLADTMGSLCQINVQSNDNMENAKKAAGIFAMSKADAEAGQSDMGNLLAAMRRMTESSDRISKVIKTIDDIAFQTSLLALNAAVEAARAGEHGRGFAIVADEVRLLAGRSAVAAKETAALIDESTASARASMERANDTSESLAKIVASVAGVSDMLGKIHGASVEQTKEIAGITAEITQINKLIADDTAVAQQTAATSAELAAQAGLMREKMRFFKLG